MPAPPTRKGLWWALGGVGVAAVVVVIALVVILGGPGSDTGDTEVTRSDRAATVDEPTGTSALDRSAGAGVVDDVAPPAPVTTRRAPTTTTPADPDVAALERLSDTADHQRSGAEALVGTWVPQIDSKKYGMTNEEGVPFWGHKEIWDNYQRYLERYPDALLVRSDDFGAFDPGYWVVLIPTTYDTPEAVLTWCSDQGFDRDHCFAKRVDHDDSVQPNTKLQPG